MGSHNPPLRNLASSLKLIPFSNRCVTLQSTPFEIFHTLIKNASFPSPTNVESHNSLPLRLSVLADTRFLLPSMYNTPIHLLRGLASLLAHHLLSTPHPCKECFVSPLQPMWDLTIHPPRSPASSLTLVSFSNRCGTLQFTPLRDLASLLAYRFVSTPFGAQPPHWHIAHLALILFVSA